MILKSFMNTIVMDLPADTQGFYSSGLGTSGFLPSQQDFINWLNYSIIQRIFTDDKCGDDVCSSSEYPGAGLFGCESDCGPQPNQTKITVNLGSFLKSRPIMNAQKWDISSLQPAADPAFRFNIFSESMQDYIYANDLSEDDFTMTSVLDGVYYLELYQTQQVSPLVPKEDFLTNSYILASTVPSRVAETDFAYGDYREFLAVSASIVDAAVAHCFGPDPPVTPSGANDATCAHFYQDDFFVRTYASYGLSGGVFVRDGNKEPVSLVNVPYCGVLPNGSLGLGGMQRFFRGGEMGEEWVDAGSKWNIPLLAGAAAVCGDDIDTSGMVNLYRSLDPQSQSTTAPAVGSMDARLGESGATPSPPLQTAAVSRRALLASAAAALEIILDGPAAEDAGPGYGEGLLWIAVDAVARDAEGRAVPDADVWLSIGGATGGCGEGRRLAGPVALMEAAPAGRVSAVWCDGNATLAVAVRDLPAVMPGPQLRITATAAPLPAAGDGGSEALVALLRRAACAVLGIGDFCEERVVVIVALPSITVSAMAESNIEAAAWRKALLDNASALLPREVTTGAGPGATAPEIAVTAVRVDVPAARAMLRTIQQPCTSHYDCDGEVTGRRTVNGTEVTEYCWGRAFCASWGSPLTSGVGPTCDHCRLYCSDGVSSVDGVCPEDCGTPSIGTLPACLDAGLLQRTYQCSSRYAARSRAPAAALCHSVSVVVRPLGVIRCVNLGGVSGPAELER